MSGCICGRCCGENRTDPDCPVCNDVTARKLAPKENYDSYYLKQALSLLDDAAAQFRMYQNQHSAKISEKYAAPEFVKERSDAVQKAIVNKVFADKIEEFIEQVYANSDI